MRSGGGAIVNVDVSSAVEVRMHWQSPAYVTGAAFTVDGGQSA